jgi:hypothetical protein
MIPKIMEGHFKMSGCDLIDVKKVFEKLTVVVVVF